MMINFEDRAEFESKFCHTQIVWLWLRYLNSLLLRRYNLNTHYADFFKEYIGLMYVKQCFTHTICSINVSSYYSLPESPNSEPFLPPDHFPFPHQDH